MHRNFLNRLYVLNSIDVHNCSSSSSSSSSTNCATGTKLIKDPVGDIPCQPCLSLFSLPLKSTMLIQWQLSHVQMQYSDDVNSGSGGTDKVCCRKYDRMGETRTIIIIIISHELGLDRLVSASSKILFKGLPSRLHPSALKFITAAHLFHHPRGNATEHTCPEAKRWQLHHWTTWR
jgi:hypothetical protein